ncbi:MAG TPA: NUDIX domain-containing protein [Pseudonocardiaceae bacterium]|jgi:ADP-ribose pyrophosphatase YjhB (NUDIX family)|nr:NUDIX domain-containing protein [Pseudonocardiaceae bacterium]
MARTDYYRDPSAPLANSIVVAVTAFVLDDAGRVLMIRRTDSGLYAIPGGGQEIGETISQTVIREVIEETGIEVLPTELIGVYTDTEHVIEYTDGEVRQEFSICFRAKPTGGKMRTSSESSAVKWVAPENLAKLNIHPSIRLRIEHGFAERTHPYYS